MVKPSRGPLPNRLPVLRAERRLSQLALATQAGISHNRYWRIENGHTTATEDERQALARVLDVDAGAIFTSEAA